MSLTFAALAWLMDSMVWGMMPSSAATTRTAISVMLAPRARMEVNASWPGVSRKAVSYTHLDVYKRQGEDGRIHSTFNQTEARTGRLSSDNPNLQNIPIRTELGSQLRAYFIAKPGCVLVDADYSLSLIHISDRRTRSKSPPLCSGYHQQNNILR